MRYCSKCGNELSDDQLYCPKCGNKEPFVTNSENSGWSNFETEKKYDGNVNYDFKNKKVVSSTDPSQKDLPKSMVNLNKVIKVFAIISMVYSLCGFVATIMIIVFSQKLGHVSLYILNWIGLGIFVIDMILHITRLSIAKSKKLQCNKNNAYTASLILSIVGVLIGIGQYFLILKAGMSPLFFIQIIMGIGLMVPANGWARVKTRR